MDLPRSLRRSCIQNRFSSLTFTNDLDIRVVIPPTG
ncbi:hypothetical protein LINPERHAP2_LOCUS36930 [Linum perenne]